MSGEKIKCVLQIFSGRKNPEWMLTKTQFDHFTEIWSKAKETNQNLKAYPALGYAGFIVQKATQHWRVYNGLVVFQETGITILKTDEDKLLEKMLLRTAPSELQELVQKQL